MRLNVQICVENSEVQIIISSANDSNELLQKYVVRFIQRSSKLQFYKGVFVNLRY